MLFRTLNGFIHFVKEGKKPIKRKTSHNSGLLFTANDWVLVYDCPDNPLVIPHHIVQTSLRPDIIIYSNTTKQVIILELTVPTEENIFHRHSDKENKYVKLLDDIKMNQWTGQVFGVEVGSRGYVARSLLYAMQKLGLRQGTIQKVRKSVSLICLRCSYAIYLSRKNVIWRPWEAKHTRFIGSPIEESPTDSVSNETQAFCGFEETDVKKFSEINKRKLATLHRETGESGSFGGFGAPAVRYHEKINSHRINILKRAARKKAVSAVNSAQIISKPPSLVKSHGKTTHSSNTHYKSRNPSLNNQDLHKPSGLVNLGNSCY